jgi:hypothetical protein
MDFEIESNNEKIKKKKKQSTIKLIILATFFLALSIILITYYILDLGSEEKETQVEEPIVIEKKKLQIVDEDSNERPVAVMIDNNIGDSLHAGLQDAYLTYEIIVEGGLTRMMALYKDKDVSLIGPVRSSRHYFLDYALESDAVYVHYGWSPLAESNIKSLGVNNINGMTDSDVFWRDSTYIAPHNVFTSINKIRSYLETKNYSESSTSWKLLNYSTDEINLSSKDDSDSETTNANENSNVVEANKIEIPYSYYQTRSYTYDSVNKYYLRSMNGKAHTDKSTNNQLNYKNIIIMKVENTTLDSDGRQDLSTVGSGTGYYITNGYATPINWTKTSRSAKTNYTYPDGTTLKVNDGNTFIQVVPINSNIVIE